MPTTPYTPARLLMNRLRQMMAAEDSAVARLAKVVRLIAGTMVADVCSIYLRRADDQLELVATEGLKPEAVASTRMRLDEGLVGQIAKTARPLSVQDAPRHPAFSYRPETGEDPYHAFLGVPILRGGGVIGVLVVQNRTERRYSEDEVEALQTIAMVLAEICANELEGNGLGDVELRPTRFQSFQGKPISEGIGIGRAVLHDVVVPAAKFFADDPDRELSRLQRALGELKLSIERIMTSDTSSLWGEPREVLETFRLLANDPSWAERLTEGVRSGLSAEAAVDRARREHRARIETARDPYLRERLNDLEDLDNRLLRILGGAKGATARLADTVDTDEGFVLVARRLGPAELLEYRDAGLSAVVLEEAGATSHAAIVARALELPTVSGLNGLMNRLEDGDMVIADAETGDVHLRPDSATLESYRGRIALRGQRVVELQQLRDLPAETRDGVTVSLHLNAGLRLDVDQLKPTGAQGIGLFRTEFQFLVSETLPKVNEQAEFYKRVLDRAEGRPVVFRTLDLGGDKILPGVTRPREENPALGVRSIRFALRQKGLFKRQLRALVRASANRPLALMFPMVTLASEFDAARGLLDAELDLARQQGQDLPTDVQCGAMIEVPSMVWELDRLNGSLDFVSIGTNDLLQFFFAADRDNAELTERYNLLSRPALEFLRDVVERCDRLGVPVSVCGEATGRLENALALLALGVRRLSMPAASLPEAKRMIRALDFAAFKADFDTALSRSNGAFLNEMLTLMRQHAADA